MDYLDEDGADWADYTTPPAVLPPALGDAFAEAVRDDLVRGDSEALDDAVLEMLDAMSAGEGFNFAKALQQIGAGAGQVLSDPTANAILRAALPIAATAAGTIVGGPAGGALANGLGGLLVSALPPARTAAAPVAAVDARPATPTPPAVANGSAAALQALLLTQQPEVLKALLSAAVGQAGRPAVNGVPVPQVLSLLNDAVGRATADADELNYSRREADGDGEGEDAVGAPDAQALYETLMDTNALELAEAWDGTGS